MKVIERAKPAGDDVHDLGMGVAKNRTHLARRKIENGPALTVVEVGALGPLHDELGESPP